VSLCPTLLLLLYRRRWYYKIRTGGIQARLVAPRQSYSAAIFNPLNTELNPTCHLLALLAHHILHVSRIRVKGRVYGSQNTHIGNP